MTEKDIKNILESELHTIQLHTKIKNKIQKTCMENSKQQHNSKTSRIGKSIAASVAIAVLGCSTVYAGYQLLNKVHVNEEALPALDAMQIVQINPLTEEADAYGKIHKDYSDFNALKQDLGHPLIDSDLSHNNPYMLCKLTTNAADYVMIQVDNFILGDTDNYEYIESENRYIYTHGTEYYSPISLTADLILSESQLRNGWDRDYLGLFQFVESYTSEQGFTVNILQDTLLEDNLENVISEKSAIFVIDGVRYSLKGRISIDTLKKIIATLK